MMKRRMMKCDCAESGQRRQVRLRQIALGAALGLIALTAIAPGVARAEDSGSDGGIFGSVLKSLGIGGENRTENPERPPPVGPPSRGLPPPHTSAPVGDPPLP